jgi:hypothetical protein
VEGLVETLGIQSLSKSQVSELAKTLDGEVAAFRARPLDAGPYAYAWLDALAVKCREAGRIVDVACVVATGVNADGHREVLGVDVLTSEDGAGWTAFLRGLVARGLGGVELVVCDAHAGLQQAIAAVLLGLVPGRIAPWSRPLGDLGIRSSLIVHPTSMHARRHRLTHGGCHGKVSFPALNSIRVSVMLCSS